MKSGVSEQARDYPTPTTEPRRAGPGMQTEAMGRDLGEQDRKFDFPQIQRKLQLTNKNAMLIEPPL